MVCDISVLYKLQVHVVGDLSRKFGVANSMYQIHTYIQFIELYEMTHLVRDFFLCRIIIVFKRLTLR